MNLKKPDNRKPIDKLLSSLDVLSKTSNEKGLKQILKIVKDELIKQKKNKPL